MTPTEAAKLLEIPADATPEQLEARFLDLRRKLEDKIAKAPTPGLQAKYRETLAQITTAFETLTLAADSSSLPVLHKPSEAGAPSPPVSAAAAPSPAAVRTAAPAAQKKSGNKEFVFVALIAVVLLGGGGWWVMQLRAEKAEQTRLTAIAAAETARAKTAEEARLAAEARRASQLRTELATAKVAWDALDNRLRDAERRASEAKSEVRGFREGPEWKKAELSALAQRHEMFTTWLNAELVSHPAKVARATAEQLLSDKLVDEAAVSVAEMKDEIARLQEFLRERSAEMLEGTDEVEITSKPTGVKFIFTDTYGRTTEGVTPAQLTGQPLSHLHDPKYDGAVGGDTEIKLGEFSVEPSVRFVRRGWDDVVQTGRLSLGTAAFFTAEFPEGSLEISSKPAGLKFTITQHKDRGWTATGSTPAVIKGVPVGTVKALVERPNYGTSYQNLDILADQTARTLTLDPTSQDVNIAVAENGAKIFVDRKFVGQGQTIIHDLVPGEHPLQIEAPGYAPFRTKFTVSMSVKPLLLRYNIKELAVENVTCPTCSGSGALVHQERCNQCNGTARVDCPNCERGATGYVNGDYGGGVMGMMPIQCRECKGRGTLPCDACDDGIYRWTTTCEPCGGDGRMSRLQMSK